jgi:hypothetical protein
MLRAAQRRRQRQGTMKHILEPGAFPFAEGSAKAIEDNPI